MTEDLSVSIRSSWGSFLLTVALLLGPVFLVAEPFERSNAGLLPFLLSAFLVSIFVPCICVGGRGRCRVTVFASLWYSLLIGVIFTLTYVLYGSPRPPDIPKGVLVLFSQAVLLSGLYVVVYRWSRWSVLAQWTSTAVGLLITGSFIYLSPVTDLLYADRFTRDLVIRAATYLNPVLAMSGSILRQDLLRGEFLYEHLALGRYYAYSAPPWQRVVLTNLTTGCLMYGIAAWCIKRVPPSDGGSSGTENIRGAGE